jgi:hypothetical protein
MKTERSPIEQEAVDVLQRDFPPRYANLTRIESTLHRPCTHNEILTISCDRLTMEGTHDTEFLEFLLADTKSPAPLRRAAYLQLIDRPGYHVSFFVSSNPGGYRPPQPNNPADLLKIASTFTTRNDLIKVYDNHTLCATNGHILLVVSPHHPLSSTLTPGSYLPDDHHRSPLTKTRIDNWERLFDPTQFHFKLLAAFSRPRLSLLAGLVHTAYRRYRITYKDGRTMTESPMPLLIMKSADSAADDNPALYARDLNLMFTAALQLTDNHLDSAYIMSFVTDKITPSNPTRILLEAYTSKGTRTARILAVCPKSEPSYIERFGLSLTL